MANRARWNNAQRRLGAGWCVHFEASRRETRDYPDGAFPGAVARLIDRERREALRDQPSFETEYFLTLTYLPPADAVRRASDWLLTRACQAQATTSYRAHLDEFNRRVAQLVNILSGFMAEVEHLGDDATLSYLHDCVSDRRLVFYR